ncbi:hypothetical protein DMB38_02675 [Streptomyces sp. WAC 06738]|uniref:caspase family protein n=1 Tax=Streptomyces sp. WAC 06738 TaxID=2203210 RepID=UPI000F6E23E7|nr:caspase family protein [Streptomyces sp. WAC 06738]AZM44870.1 hypothetical protein DMB38_02675 [Streptomyces sp. WAC 06738]
MSEPARSYRALLIGNAVFPEEPDLRALQGPEADLSELRAALTDPTVGLPWQVGRPLLDADSPTVAEALVTFFQQASSQDQLLLYYSGHGLLDLRNRLHLCTRDTSHEWLRTRSLRHSFVNELMDDCAARAIILILDCCFSGTAAVKGADPAAQFAGHGRFVMTSSGPNETSYDGAAGKNRGDENGQGRRPSLFTEHLVAGLRHGAVGHDGFVTVTDVYHYVHARLRALHQQPLMKTDGQAGQVWLARRPLRREPGSAGTEDRSAPPAAVDVRPVFTDPRGRTVRARTESHFSGVVHVFLPGSSTVLSIHRDRLIAAGEGTEVTAVLSKRPKHVRSAPGENGDALFHLPDGSGTVRWSASRLRAFRRSTGTGGWPTSAKPTQPRGTHAALVDADEAYESFARSHWSALRWLLLDAAAVATVVLAGSTGLGRALTNPLTLCAFVILLGGVTLFFRRARERWAFLRMRRFLLLPVLPVTRMLMTVNVDEDYAPSGAGLAIPPARATEVHAQVRSEGEPEFHLSIPLLDSYIPRIKQGLPPFDAPDGTPRPVDVIGLPAEGQWVAVRTPQGVLWPRGRAR